MQELTKNLTELASNKKLLLVDDDLITRDILQEFLSEFFLSIDTADNGADALELYNKNSYDLIISDIEMPKLNGIQLSKNIKNKNPNQVILISTSYTDEQYLVELINIGIEGFLKKPTKITQLQQTILKALKIVEYDKTKN